MEFAKCPGLGSRVQLAADEVQIPGDEIRVSYFFRIPAEWPANEKSS